MQFIWSAKSFRKLFDEPLLDGAYAKSNSIYSFNFNCSRLSPSSFRFVGRFNIVHPLICSAILRCRDVHTIRLTSLRWKFMQMLIFELPSRRHIIFFCSLLFTYRTALLLGCRQTAHSISLTLHHSISLMACVCAIDYCFINQQNS